MIRLPDGTLAFAAGLRDALQLDLPRPDAALGSESEVVLLQATECGAHHLADVKTERLEPGVAALLEAASTGLDEQGQRSLAAKLGVTNDELMDFARTLIDEGVLVAG